MTTTAEQRGEMTGGKRGSKSKPKSVQKKGKRKISFGCKGRRKWNVATEEGETHRKGPARRCSEMRRERSSRIPSKRTAISGDEKITLKGRGKGEVF